MSFDTIEVSEYFEPLELYEFTRGTVNWRYTSADEDITFNTNVFEAVPIKRSNIIATQDIGKSTLKVDVSRRNTFVQQYIASSPTDVISLKVYRIHGADMDPAVTFIGRVVNVDFQENKAQITLHSNQSSLRRPGLRRAYQTTCPHVLYGEQCRANSTLFKTDAVLTGVSGLTLSSSAFVISVNPTFDASWFVGGYVDVVKGGLTERRFITEHDNGTGTLTVNLPFVGLAVGDAVSAFAGCDHTPETCVGKFSNIDNYGGFPFIPKKNPMDGTSIF